MAETMIATALEKCIVEAKVRIVCAVSISDLRLAGNWIDDMCGIEVYWRCIYRKMTGSIRQQRYECNRRSIRLKESFVLSTGPGVTRRSWSVTGERRRSTNIFLFLNYCAFVRCVTRTERSQWRQRNRKTYLPGTRQCHRATRLGSCLYHDRRKGCGHFIGIAASQEKSVTHELDPDLWLNIQFVDPATVLMQIQTYDLRWCPEFIPESISYNVNKLLVHHFSRCWTFIAKNGNKFKTDLAEIQIILDIYRAQPGSISEDNHFSQSTPTSYVCRELIWILISSHVTHRTEHTMISW